MECEAAALTNDRGVVVVGVLVDHRFRTTCFGREACCALEDRVVGVVLPNWKIRGYFQEVVGLGPDEVHTIVIQANFIDGRLPPSFGFLKSLTALDLANKCSDGSYSLRVQRAEGTHNDPAAGQHL